MEERLAGAGSLVCCRSVELEEGFTWCVVSLDRGCLRMEREEGLIGSDSLDGCWKIEGNTGLSRHHVSFDGEFYTIRVRRVRSSRPTGIQNVWRHKWRGGTVCSRIVSWVCRLKFRRFGRG